MNIKSQRGSTLSALAIFVTIGLVVLTICLIPLANTANKVDDAAQQSLQTALDNFTREAANKGSVNRADFEALIEEITGANTYDVSIEVSIQGENAIKTSQVSSDKIGENSVTVYATTQVEEYWDSHGGKFPLGVGGQVTVKAQNTNVTTGQQISSPTSSDTATIVAESTATCTVDAN